MGGYSAPAYFTLIDYVTMATTGNAADFGDLTDGNRGGDHGASTRTRGVLLGSERTSSAVANVIDYVTIPSLGNAADFGDLTAGRRIGTSTNNQVRAVHSGGYTGSASNIIDYITIASTGNAVDFGDGATQYNRGGTSSNTRGVFGGGRNPVANTIDYIQFSTLGDATDFGDLSTARGYLSGTSNEKRGVFVSGMTPSHTVLMDFINIASTGDAADFGDCIVSVAYAGACSQGHGGIEEGEPRGLPLGSGRAYFGGGETPARVNTINEIHIPTLGSVSDFGDAKLGYSSTKNGANSYTRAIIMNRLVTDSPYVSNVIESFEMHSRGNAADFGDLTTTRREGGNLSNSTRGITGGGQDP